MIVNGFPYRPCTTTFSTKLKKNTKKLQNVSQLSVEHYVQALTSYCKPPNYWGYIYSAPRTTRQPQFLEDILAKKPTELSHVPSELQIRCSTWILSSRMTVEEANCLGRVIAPILPVFTEAKAIENIAIAISKGKFGKPMEEEVALAFIQNLHLFTSFQAQRSMTEAIKSCVFGRPMNKAVALAFVKNIHIFKDPLAQINIGSALNLGVFGDPVEKDSAIELVQKLGHLTMRLKEMISTAIKTGKFGNPIEEAVALAFSQNLHLFSSVEAQRTMSDNILSNRFGDPMDEQVSRAIAQNLTVFKYPQAKENIVVAIISGKFGNSISSATQSLLNETIMTVSPNKLKTLATELNLTSEFKLDTLACMRLPISAEYATLTSDLEKIEQIPSFSNGFQRFKPTAQQSARVFLPQAIPLVNQYKDISTCSMLETIETKYPGVRLLLQDAAQWVAQIDTLKLAVTNESQEEQHQIMAALRYFNYQDYEHIVGLELFLTDITNELNRLQSELNSELRTAFSMENIRLPLGSTMVTMNSKALEYLNTMMGTELSNCFSHSAVTYQFYGHQDTTPTLPKLLLVYECETAKDKADFSGWLSDTDYMLYKDVVEKVKIYDLTGQEPMLLDIRDKEHESFNDLPLFMKSGVLGNLFNIDEYRFKEDLNCILGDNGIIAQLRSEHSENEDNLGVIAKMKCIIQACIVKQGDKVAIFPDSTQNNHYKNKLNELLYSRGNINDYINLVSTFLETREESSAARLAFLFGQIAKTGVLGYEFNGINQANGFFYTLSKECFKRLTRQTISDVQKVSLLSHLNEGVCIEQVTHDFHVSYPACGQVWQTTL